jgi:hypothetical protein
VSVPYRHAHVIVVLTYRVSRPRFARRSTKRSSSSTPCLRISASPRPCHRPCSLHLFYSAALHGVPDMFRSGGFIFTVSKTFPFTHTLDFSG